MTAKPQWVSTGVKPLSVNEAFMGRKVKSQAYRHYERVVLRRLPLIEIPEGLLELKILVLYSSRRSDIDNALKPFLDILQKRYGFDDNRIYKLTVRKAIVPKGQETIKFTIAPYLQPAVYSDWLQWWLSKGKSNDTITAFTEPSSGPEPSGKRPAKPRSPKRTKAPSS